MNTNVSVRPFIVSAILVAGILSSGCKNNMKIKTLPYPQTAQGDVVDNYHGTEVADPYRWLEDDNSAETAAWVKAENGVTFDYLSQIPYRDRLKQRLTELWNYERIGIPQKVGEYFMVSKNDGLQNQSVIYLQKGVDDQGEVFLDPNTLSEDGTVALSDVSYSKDGKYMAYALAASGSDWVDIYVKEIPSGRVLDDKISWVKFSGAVWAPDSKGFYYSGYDEPTKGTELSGQNRNQKIYYHSLGTPQAADRLIYEDPEHPLLYLSGEVSSDNKWLFVTATEGTSGTEILYKANDGKGEFKVLFKGYDNEYMVVKCKDDVAYVLTNLNAPNYRLVKVDMKNPMAAVVDVIAESADNLLQSVSFTGGNIFANYLVDAADKIYQYSLDGERIREIDLATIGKVSGFYGEDEDTVTYYSLSNFISPTEIYGYDIQSGKSQSIASPEVAYDTDLLVAEQVFYTSKDGTRVPMFLVHRKDIKLDGSNPTYLYGYGGFNITYGPGYRPLVIALAEQGGVYALANIRGGSEYGERWHKAGMLENKQNVFDDFIAAGEYLIEKGYTSSDKLAIAGGSNGGLLVGACMLQRPDLFAVALPAVGVMDMLRYHLFTCGWGWVVEYGCSDSPEQFEYIYKYSPLHNIKQGVCYPATLITTADHDDRVVPAHSFKFAAMLQAAQGCDRPVLIRIETNAGHGSGKPVAKTIEEQADVLSFLFWNTNSKVE